MSIPKQAVRNPAPQPIAPGPASKARNPAPAAGPAGAPPAAPAATPAIQPLLGTRAAYGAAFLSGFLYFVAFPGVDVWPLAFVALVPLVVALRGQSTRRATALGWVAGFTMTMFGFYWLLDMLQVFSGFPLPICFLFMALLCGYQAGRIALFGWLHARAEQRGWPAIPLVLFAFAASELIYPLLFPWTYAATVHQVPALTQLAELGSPIAVALVLLCANLAIAEPILARLEGRAARWRICGILAAVPLLAMLYGAIRIPQVDAAVAEAPKARVGLVQANMSLLGKRRDRTEGLRRHLALTRELVAERPLDLVVWSETSVTGAAEEQMAPALYRMQFTASLGVPAIFGGVLVRRVDDAREYVLFNSALLSDESGAVTGRYDKQYLLAFGEYLPFGDVFPVLYEWSPKSGRFTPGTTLEPLRLGDHEIATFICYEDIIPSFVNSIMRHGDPDLLVNLTNDAWFGDTTEPWIHLALAKFRAIEQRRFFVRSTNSGVSAFIDPVGRVMAHTQTFRAEALAQDVAWLRGKTPYRLWGDAPWWLASAGMLGAAFVRNPRRRPKPA
jgi:apolipoprotein N-acyltransferase